MGEQVSRVAVDRGAAGVVQALFREAPHRTPSVHRPPLHAALAACGDRVLRQGVVQPFKHGQKDVRTLLAFLVSAALDEVCSCIKSALSAIRL